MVLNVSVPDHYLPFAFNQETLKSCIDASITANDTSGIKSSVSSTQS